MALSLPVISLLVGIIGTLLVTASQWYPTSELHAEHDAIHIWLPHLVENALGLQSKNSAEFFEHFCAFLKFIDELPLYNIFIGITVVSVALLLYRTLLEPLRLIRKLGDVGYITDGRNMKEVANYIRAGDIPPVYPNGWFSLLRSWELKKGEVKYVQALGQDFAVYRGEEDGTAYVLEAFCTHLGANLGVGGKVKGECVECPFHGWTFRGYDGKCMDIPYTKQKVPEIANTRAWICVEINNEICIWHHAESAEPEWQLPELKDIRTGWMKFHGYAKHYVTSHIQEIPENAADLVPSDRVSDKLHSPVLPAASDLRYKLSWIWGLIPREGNWRQDEDNKHMAVLTLHYALTVFGFRVPYANIKVTTLQIGSGVVHMHVNLPLLGNIVLIQTVLPLEPLVQKLIHCIYTTPLIPRPLAKFILWVISSQLERDMMLWNYKKFNSKPNHVKERSIIAKHSSWYSQFYSKNSPRYTPRKDGIDW